MGRSRCVPKICDKIQISGTGRTPKIWYMRIMWGYGLRYLCAPCKEAERPKRSIRVDKTNEKNTPQVTGGM